MTAIRCTRSDPQVDSLADRLRKLTAEETGLTDRIGTGQGSRLLASHLFREDSLGRIQGNLRRLFLSPDGGLTKRHLDPLVRRVVLGGGEMGIETNGAALLEGGPQNGNPEAANHRALVLAIGNAWLPPGEPSEPLTLELAPSIAVGW